MCRSHEDDRVDHGLVDEYDNVRWIGATENLEPGLGRSGWPSILDDSANNRITHVRVIRFRAGSSTMPA
jgi:hypothetical protein